MSHGKSSSAGFNQKNLGREFSQKSSSNPDNHRSLTRYLSWSSDLSASLSSSGDSLSSSSSPALSRSSSPLATPSSPSTGFQPSSPLHSFSLSSSSAVPIQHSSSSSPESSSSIGLSQDGRGEAHKIPTFILWDQESQGTSSLHNEFQISSHAVFDMDKKDVEYECRICDPDEATEFVKLIQEKLKIIPIQVIPMSSLLNQKPNLTEEDISDLQIRVERASKEKHRNLIYLGELYPEIPPKEKKDETKEEKEKREEKERLERQERPIIDRYARVIQALDSDAEAITDRFAFIPSRHGKEVKFTETTRAFTGKSETAHQARLSVKRAILKGDEDKDSKEAEEIALREFVNFLTVEASLGFRPVFGFSGVIENGKLTEIHTIEPWIPFTLRDLLTSNFQRNPGIETTTAQVEKVSFSSVDPKVDLFLVDEIQMAFQLVQIIEEMRYDYRILKYNAFAAHCDIKPDNILVLRMPAPYGWMTLLFDVETSRVHSQLEDKGTTVIMIAGVAAITQPKLGVNKEIRDHLHDIDRLQEVIRKIVSKQYEKEPWFAKFDGIVKELNSTNRGHQFNIFDVSLDFHLVCVWILSGLCYEENSDFLFGSLKKMANEKTLCGDLCVLPDLSHPEPKPLFNWIYVVKEEKGGNLKVKVCVSSSKPEGCVIYVSSEHTTVQQTQTVVVICQILEHIFLLFPFDPKLASTTA